MTGQQIYTQLDVRLTYIDGKPVPVAMLEPSDDASAAAQFLGRWLLSWRDDQAERDAVAAAQEAIGEPPPEPTPPGELWQRTWRRGQEFVATALYSKHDGPPPWDAAYFRERGYDYSRLTFTDQQVTARD